MTTADLQATAARLPELLTPHQLRIIALARGGRTVVQIAAAIGKSPATVTYHKNCIRSACGGVAWSVVELLHQAAGLPAETN